MKSSLCDPYELGYTRATMKITISYKKIKILVNLSKIFVVRIIN